MRKKESEPLDTNSVINYIYGNKTEGIMSNKYFAMGLFLVYTVLAISFSVQDNIPNAQYFSQSSGNSQNQISPEQNILITDNVQHNELLQVEDFSSTTFPPTGWTLTGPNTQWWVRNSMSAWCAGSGCAKFDFWNSSQGQTASLESPVFSPTVAGDTCKFDQAYASYYNAIDSIILETSTNGGLTWSVLYRYWGGLNSNMCTVSPCNGNINCFTWITRSHLYPVGTNKVRFRAVSGFGNNFYLDNVQIGNTIIGIGNNGNGIPSVYRLNQNYPNPFNPVTNVSYDIPVPGNVKLVIYDILGREVRVLINEFKNAGRYNVDFDGEGLTSGTYIYKLESGSFTDTKKMILMK